MDIKESLKNLNLNEKEVEVYLILLELGESSIIPVRKRALLPRTTVFHILEKLNEKGLVEIIETPSRRLYSPYPPRKILTLLNEEAEKLKDSSEKLKEALPQLNQLYNFSPFQPKVRFFVGQEIKQIYEEILTSPIEEVLYVGETNKLVGILSESFFKSWVLRKVKKGIWTRSIRVKSAESDLFTPKEGLRKARFAPEGFSAPAHIYIYHNSVAILTSAKENFGLVTTSQDFAQTMRNWFEALWQISEE